MARVCNGPNCDCDICHNTNGCDERVICDHCDEEIYDDYYYCIDGTDLCLECLNDLYRRSAY